MLILTHKKSLLLNIKNKNKNLISSIYFYKFHKQLRDFNSSEYNVNEVTIKLVKEAVLHDLFQCGTLLVDIYIGVTTSHYYYLILLQLIGKFPHLYQNFSFYFLSII